MSIVFRTPFPCLLLQSPPLLSRHILTTHTLFPSLPPCSCLLSILLLCNRLQSSSRSAGNTGNKLKWREQQQLMVKVEAIFHQIRLTVSLIRLTLVTFLACLREFCPYPHSISFLQFSVIYCSTRFLNTQTVSEVLPSVISLEFIQKKYAWGS